MEKKGVGWGGGIGVGAARTYSCFPHPSAVIPR